MFKFIRDMEELPDLVFWTGDNIAHDVWNQTAHKNADYTIKITQWIQKNWGDIPVFPTMGNHEFFPVNVMNFDGPQPILRQIGKVWKQWLGKEGYNLFKKYGYYTLPLRGINETWDGFRVLALNTESCNNMNWYLFTQLNDPADHLLWIEQQLILAEQNNEKVYILAHVQPGGEDCLYEWSVRYRALVERYQHVILVHFVGHEHEEFFNVFTDTKNSSAIGMMHGPGGVTTFTDNNPAFRIYDIDYETGYPVKAYKYFFNITQANLGDPKWELAHEWTEEYGLTDMSPDSFRNLTKRFLTEPDTATKYLRNTHSKSTTKENLDCSNSQCKHNTYCETNNIIHFESKD